MSNVWQVDPKDKNKFHKARMGDHLMVPFECNTCFFRKLFSREPTSTTLDGLKAAAIICCMILDSFWSRATSTVEANAKTIQKGCKLSALIGLEPPYLDPGPLPSFDHCGYGVAAQMLLASQEPGKYSSLYKQFDTIRQFKSAFGNKFGRLL
jgi:hypothetical protein